MSGERSSVDVVAAAQRPRSLSTVHMFASPPGAPRSRRPTDVVQVVLAAAVVLALAPTADGETTAVSEAIGALVDVVPTVVDPVWQMVLDIGVLWSTALAIVAVVRRQWGLLAVMASAASAAVVGASVLSRWLTGDWPRLPGSLAGVGTVAVFPAVGTALVVAVLSVSSPYLARPFRRLGRVMWSSCVVAVLALGVATPDIAVAGAALGLAVAAAVHLVTGSPGGRPTRAEVAAGLADLRLDAVPVGAVSVADGVAFVDAEDRSGRTLRVKVYGRDAWDGQLIASLWRFVFYRDGAPAVALTRWQQVEHEAVMMYQAERRGAPVTPVAAAGRSTTGDALLVVQHPGATLADADEMDDELLGRCWQALDRLHASGIVHGRISPDSVALADGTPLLTGFASAQVALEPHAASIDRAQMLVTLSAVAGVERAVGSALATIGADGLVAASSYVQPAALPGVVRRSLGSRGIAVDDIRAAALAACGAESADLPRLRRVTWGSLLMAVLLLVAGTALVTSLVDIGLDTILDALAEASWAVVLLAFLVGQTPRVANALALSAASPTPLPLGRLVALQFATTFINLAVPSTAGRVALNIRFFRRAGVGPAGATAIGALDGLAGFVGQILLIGSILLLGAGTLDLGLGERVDPGAWVPLVALLVALLVLVVTVVLAVPVLRRRVVVLLRPALAPLQVLRSPRRAVQLVGANVAAELLFALAMTVVLRAFGQDVSYVDVVLINELVALFAGLMPVPGGIGVTEAALTAGFVAVGVPEATAFAAALTYRLVTYYTPPVIGLPCLRWLQRSGYL